MRILVVNDLFPPVVRGGYEVECRDVVTHLRERHDVTVLTSELDRANVSPQPGTLRELPWIGGQSRPDAALAPVTTARAIATVRRTLRDVDPDVIWLWNGAGIPSGAVRALQESPAPLLVRVCEYWFGVLDAQDQFTKWLTPDPGRRGARAWWGRAIRAANRAPALRVDVASPQPVAVSWNSEYVRAHAQPPDGYRIVHEEITIPSNARTEEMKGIERTPLENRILYVGRLEPMKGAQVVIRALATLRSEHGIDATLHVVGSGTPQDRATLTEVAQRNGVDAQVHLPGALRGDALRAEIAQATVWAVPSVWDEPAPLTALEAAMAQVPVVASRVGGIPEVLEPDTCALFHERDDAAGCARALAQTLAGGDDVTARVQRAHRRALELSFDVYLERMDRFLAEGMAALRAGRGAEPAVATTPA